MTRLALVDRVRSWFGRKAETVGAAASAAPWPLGPGARTELALAGAAATGRAPPAPHVPRDTLALESVPHAHTETTATAPSRTETDAQPPPAKTCLDPLDPEWIQAMPSLEEIGRELDGHRRTNRTIMDAVQQLPDLASNQADLTTETNKVLERQSALLESILDSLVSLRSAFRTVDESSRRHAAVLGQLEASHRQILLGYQAMLLRAHRRLGRLAAMAVLVAAAALGGVACVAYLVLVAP